MSTLTHLVDLPDQICYVQCGFCTTILLVSVPCSSLSMVVTVRCGHCTSLLSVNMMKVSFVPLHLLASLGHDDDQQKEQLNPEEVDGGKGIDTQSSLMVMTSSDNEEDHDQINPAVNRVINKPPEKRQRAPSAYNQFIKQEIRRLKAEHPNMAHKEAFSTAAKNWAHFPPINHREGESSITGFDEENGNWNFDAAEINIKSKGSCHERKVPRHSILAKTPFEY